MHLALNHVLVPLDQPAPLRLTDIRGTRLRARDGTLWITIDGDHRDIVLEDGQQWVVDSPGVVMVTALGGKATLELCEKPAQPRKPAVPAKSYWYQTLDSLWDRDSRGLVATS